MMFAAGITDHPGLFETIAAGGLGASLSIILVKWLMNQHSNSITRLSTLEDERATIIRETVQALNKASNEIRELVVESRKRGTEINRLCELLKERPCIYGSKDHKG